MVLMKLQGLCTYIDTKNYILNVMVWDLMSGLHTTNTALVGVLNLKDPGSIPTLGELFISYLLQMHSCIVHVTTGTLIQIVTFKCIIAICK